MIQFVDVSIYCLWCITIQRYIAQYKVESKQWSMLFFNVALLFLREISELIFLEKHYILFSLTTMYNNLIVSHVNKPRYVDISRYTIYRYIVVSLVTTNEKIIIHA